MRSGDKGPVQSIRNKSSLWQTIPEPGCSVVRIRYHGVRRVSQSWSADIATVSVKKVPLDMRRKPHRAVVIRQKKRD